MKKRNAAFHSLSLLLVVSFLTCTGVSFAHGPLRPRPTEPSSGEREKKREESKVEEKKAEDSKTLNLVFEDQFGRRQELAAYLGDIVVFVYSDRKGTDSTREVFENLHVLFHPNASGQTLEKGRAAPVAPLPGIAPGKRSPNVVVIRASANSGSGKEAIRSRLKKSSPEIPVWIDFNGTLEKEFDLKAGEVNLAVIDAEGRLRVRVNGDPDKKAWEKTVQRIQDLRAEAVDPKKK